MSMGGTPWSLASDTISRLVEVPIVVAMPPMITAKFIGMSIRAGAWPARMASPITTGISTTTTGVSLMKALRIIALASSTSRATWRLKAQRRASRRASGSRAPVTIRARPRIIRQQIATSASWPKPEKICCTPSRAPSCSNGNRWKPRAKAAITISPVTGIGMRSTVNRTKATTVRARTAIAWALRTSSLTREGYPKKNPACAGSSSVPGHPFLLLCSSASRCPLVGGSRPFGAPCAPSSYSGHPLRLVRMLSGASSSRTPTRDDC